MVTGLRQTHHEESDQQLMLPYSHKKEIARRIRLESKLVLLQFSEADRMSARQHLPRCAVEVKPGSILGYKT